MNQSNIVDFGSVLVVADSFGVFSSLCTIQKLPQPPTADGIGQASQENWTDLAGHVDIPCMKASGFVPDVASGEMNTAGYTSEQNAWHILLKGHYPLIRSRYRAVVDGEPFDIGKVEPDSQRTQTRMAARRYSL